MCWTSRVPAAFQDSGTPKNGSLEHYQPGPTHLPPQPPSTPARALSPASDSPYFGPADYGNPNGVWREYPPAPTPHEPPLPRPPPSTRSFVRPGGFCTSNGVPLMYAQCPMPRPSSPSPPPPPTLLPPPPPRSPHIPRGRGRGRGRGGARDPPNSAHMGPGAFSTSNGVLLEYPLCPRPCPSPRPPRPPPPPPQMPRGRGLGRGLGRAREPRNSVYMGPVGLRPRWQGPGFPDGTGPVFF